MKNVFRFALRRYSDLKGSLKGIKNCNFNKTNSSCRVFSTESTLNSFLTDNKVQNYFDSVHENNQLIPYAKPLQRETIKHLLNDRSELINSLKELDELMNEKNSDDDFKASIAEECQSFKNKLLVVENDLFEALLPDDEASEFNEAVLEVSAGVGGQEAMLFARNLFDMYLGYVNYKGWNHTLAEHDNTDLGGLRFGSILVEGEDVFKWLQFETGVHRVQRIPATERSGRVHTSTATVAVLPQPKEIDVKIDDKDLVVETKRASGAGGQHVNTTDSAVRLTHIPTGLVVECQTERSQIQNRVIALKRLKAKMFQIQTDNQAAELRNLRKLQVGSSSRSDKIRTYNFNQDRITDHRLTSNFHNLDIFMLGDKSLDQLIEKLLELSDTKRINFFLESLGVKT